MSHTLESAAQAMLGLQIDVPTNFLIDGVKPTTPSDLKTLVHKSGMQFTISVIEYGSNGKVQVTRRS